jgi:hypothetical protein
MHCTEDDLILHYYGERRRFQGRHSVERHLEACEACAAAYREIAATLDLIAAPDIPERGEQYGLEVWQQIRLRLPDQEAPWWTGRRLAVAGGVMALVLAAFIAGRVWPRDPLSVSPVQSAAGNTDSSERVRLAAVGDHLEQSERVLLDLMNVQGDRVDLSDQQVWAADLIDSNRLYRDAAAQAGDVMIASVLDDLERSLLDVVHGPSTMTPAQLDEVRTRVDAAALLFKVRVLADELHERETAPVPLRKTT